METKVKEKTQTKIELCMCADPDYLSVARAAVRQVSQSLGVAEEEIEPITVALVEALTNVIRHGYGGACEKPIILKLNKIECGCGECTSAMEIVVRDFGKQVDPASIEGRDLEDIKPGGVGVHIMKSVMDVVEFSPNEDCGMQLRMVKCIKKKK